eukprot:scaffold14195_cov155-Skeletonema_dohrnii-CCMP3373.AAC.7
MALARWDHIFAGCACACYSEVAELSPNLDFARQVVTWQRRRGAVEWMAVTNDRRRRIIRSLFIWIGGDVKMSSKDNVEVDATTNRQPARVVVLLAALPNDNCQQEHQAGHDAMCKERAAELRDELLFRQPESSHLGDCPICFLPFSIDPQKSTLMGCCSKLVCEGCSYANLMREREEHVEHTCPFCRHPIRTTDEEEFQNTMRRAAAKDPIAMIEMGKKLHNEGCFESAFIYWARAAALGDASAHYLLSVLYREGEGVEKDEKKEFYHLEEAAVAGHPRARYYLGCIEDESSRFDRAVKHWTIGASLGCDKSIQRLMQYYATHGAVNKEDFAAALRAHHAAANAAKSPQREAAAVEIMRWRNE